MDCKLSKDSLVELQLIRHELIDDYETLYPCCEKKIVEHRNGRRKLLFVKYLSL